MDGSKLLMIGGLGVGGYLAYQWYQKNYGAVVAPAAAPAATAAASSPAASAAAPSPTPAARPLDSIYHALASEALASGVNLSTGVLSGGQPCDPNGWNYFLSQVYSLPGGVALPGDLFPASAQSQPMTLAAYWGVMAPWLASTQGLSGLGTFGGLGAIAARMRRAY